MNEVKADHEPCRKTKLMTRMIGNSSRLSLELNRRMKQELSLSLAKYEVLVAIDRAEGGEITMSDLSRELFVSNANMTGMTTRLQKDGLVEKRSRPTDRRIYSVVLTERGAKKLEEASVKHSLWIRELFSSIDADEVESVNSFLDKVDDQAELFAQNA